nr:MAG TPA: hypothetical protein [Caudoviricetes sp.]
MNYLFDVLHNQNTLVIRWFCAKVTAKTGQGIDLSYPCPVPCPVAKSLELSIFFLFYRTGGQVK